MVHLLLYMGDVKIQLPRPLVCRSLSPPAATGGLEQLYSNMINLNVQIIDIIVKVYLLFVTALMLYVYKSN